MKTLVALNDPAYGTECSYNGLRLAHSLAKRNGEEVRIFLLADAVTCALAGQQTPNGYYNLERMLAAAVRPPPRCPVRGVAAATSASAASLPA